MKIPDKGAAKDEVFARLKAIKGDDTRWHEGRTFASVFLASQEAKEMAEEAYRLYLWENGLDPTIYPSLITLETEIVAMAASHLGGDDETVGNFTSGGTESVMLAVKAARDRFLSLNPGVEMPEMVLPLTAHPCFHKAAHYFRLKTVQTPVDPVTCRADVAAMEAAITGNTMLLVGSAASYAHGAVDPIREIGEVALKRGLLFHVDGCIGGFLLPYFKRLGAEVTDFDFSVPGVTSISMDFHKYAFAAKGASVVLYKNAELRQHQIYTFSGWPGYSIINPTIQSSKSGGPLAGTWAVMNYFGDDGYLAAARDLKAATDQIVAGIEAMDEYTILGKPEMTLLAIVSDKVSIFQLCDEMMKYGWHMQPQFKTGGLKESFHLTVLPRNVDKIDAWLADLRTCTDELMSKPPSENAASLKEAVSTIDFSQLTAEQIEQMLEMVGLGKGDLPGGLADINEVLNEIASKPRDRILTVYYNKLNRYKG